jgi:4-carboxymuconolactone decarboxylase
VTAKEVSEIITHLAFYSGWSNAMDAVAAAQVIFLERKIGIDQLPEASPSLLPIDQVAENQRVKGVQERIGPVSQGLVDYTTDPLFVDLWLRPDLTPRDRSLVTVSALIANGQLGQFSSHLNRARQNGVTEEEAGETILQSAFYAGWPNAFSAAAMASDLFKTRAAR